MHIITSIILNWNGWQLTLHCLNSLFSLKLAQELQLTIIIFDNGSTDNSTHEISTWVKSHNLITAIDNSIPLVILQNATNLGYAGGMNQAIKHALKLFNPNFIWLLNNDTSVTVTSLQELMNCAIKNPNIVLWGSTICDYSNPLITKSAGGCRYNHWFTTYHSIGYNITLSKVITWKTNPHLDYIDGSAWLIRREALDTIGLLNEDYFLYFEELDYAHRTRQHGCSLGWCRNSIVYHHGGQSVKKLATQFNSRYTANYYADLSAFKFTWNYHRRILWIAIAARISGRILKIVITGKWRLISSLWYAYYDFLNWQPTNNSMRM